MSQVLHTPCVAETHTRAPLGESLSGVHDEEPCGLDTGFSLVGINSLDSRTENINVCVCVCVFLGVCD